MSFITSEFVNVYKEVVLPQVSKTILNNSKPRERVHVISRSVFPHFYVPSKIEGKLPFISIDPWDTNVIEWSFIMPPGIEPVGSPDGRINSHFAYLNIDQLTKH